MMPLCVDGGFEEYERLKMGICKSGNPVQDVDEQITLNHVL
jgi:hypothetical protein